MVSWFDLYILRSVLIASALCLGGHFPATAQDLNVTLMDAVRASDSGRVQILLAQGAKPNAKDKNGRTPLMEAASAGSTSVARLLLKAGADPNAADSSGWTPLFWAVFAEKVTIAKLLASNGAYVNAKDMEGRTALFWAATSGYSRTVSALLALGADANAVNRFGWTPLMSCSSLGHLETARALVRHGADARVQDGSGKTAFRLAQENNHPDIVAMLKSAPAQSKGIGSTGNIEPSVRPAPASTEPDRRAPATKVKSASPPSSAPTATTNELNQQLLVAAESGSTPDVTNLIRSGAAVNTHDPVYGSTPVIGAAARGHLETLRALLDRGGDPNSSDSAGRTALMEASVGGYSDVVRLLIEKGALVNAKDREGWSPLFWATFSRRTETVRLLLEQGANPNLKNKYDDAPLILAAYQGDTSTLSVLLKHHAEVQLQDAAGKTALIESVRQGHLEVVRILLQAGAPPDTRAKDGTTALTVAESQHFSDIAALLKAPGPAGNSVDDKHDEQAPPPAASVPAKGDRASSDSLPSSIEEARATSRAMAYFRLGLRIRMVEDLWQQPGHVAERAAANLIADLTDLGAPDATIRVVNVLSTQLATPPEQRKESVSAALPDFRKRLNAVGMDAEADQFFYVAGQFTYDLSLFAGQLTRKERPGEVQTPPASITDAAAAILARQCSATPLCKDRALPSFQRVVELLQKPELVSADGAALLKLSDDIAVALGTSEQ
jgi:ankyrin repeat protein